MTNRHPPDATDVVRVTVCSYGRGRCLAMQYRDPHSSKRVVRSTGTSNRREAERAAVEWETELRQKRYQIPSRVTWQEFVDLYEREHLVNQSEATGCAQSFWRC